MAAQVQHLHTYFYFPFSIDKEEVRERHPRLWQSNARWIDGLDEWIASERSPLHDLKWTRSSYTKFDMSSRAYQDMIFFHPIVRRVFFDTAGQEGSRESLLRCYRLMAPDGSTLRYECSDRKGGQASTAITDLRLFLFANGVGVLSIGVEDWNLSAKQALWINESMRKVYPSSARQVREGRTPSRAALTLDGRVLAEETFESGAMVGFQPPLASTIKSLLYFANYDEQEYEPVLDERMIVYTYFEIDPVSVPDGFKESEEYQVLLSRLLFVEQEGDSYRYEPEFLRHRMQQHLYRRWAHEGTYYGFSSYSNVTAAIGKFDCGSHQLAEGFLIHRMFDTRYYLMALVGLFYRATLLDFSEQTALVSRRLYQTQLTPVTVSLANELRAEFLHFSNYWHFDELANKEEELEHFELQCRFYRITSMKNEIEGEIRSMGSSLQEHYQFRNTEAINRVAMLSMILGLGAMITGFFGMNFGKGFAAAVFEPPPEAAYFYYAAIALVLTVFFGALSFSLWVVSSNWSDYKDILNPSAKQERARSLRREF